MSGATWFKRLEVGDSRALEETEMSTVPESVMNAHGTVKQLEGGGDRWSSEHRVVVEL